MKKDMVSDLNMSHGRMYDFVLFPLFKFTLVTKPRNLDFKVRQNTSIFFDKKMMSDLIMSCQTTVSDLA